MQDPKHIKINEFYYNLPDSKIAKYPLSKRDSSKLLSYKDGIIEDHIFSSLPDLLPDDSLLVYNDTKVIQARMFFYKDTGAKIEIFCLDPHNPHDYTVNFARTKSCSWLCLIGNAKKWKSGELMKKITINNVEVTIKANKTEIIRDSQIVEFSWDKEDFTFSDILDHAGELPIPPYLNRETEENDKTTYQTLYSKTIGSVAAPTAGLHFTEEVFENLQKKGIKSAEVTLHVGAGTFKPVKSDIIEEHEMHSEFITVSRNTIGQLLKHKGNIVAIGTTSVRTLESLYFVGCLLENNENNNFKIHQWSPYESKCIISKEKALQNIADYLDKNNLDILIADTQIMIVPGYEFKMTDIMVTNFHQPKSTLLLLVSAFIGGDWVVIYDHALFNGYRFLSYGDSSVLFRKKQY